MYTNPASSNPQPNISLQSSTPSEVRHQSQGDTIIELSQHAVVDPHLASFIMTAQEEAARPQSPASIRRCEPSVEHGSKWALFPSMPENVNEGLAELHTAYAAEKNRLIDKDKILQALKIVRGGGTTKRLSNEEREQAVRLYYEGIGGQDYDGMIKGFNDVGRLTPLRSLLSNILSVTPAIYLVFGDKDNPIKHAWTYLVMQSVHMMVVPWLNAMFQCFIVPRQETARRDLSNRRESLTKAPSYEKLNVAFREGIELAREAETDQKSATNDDERAAASAKADRAKQRIEKALTQFIERGNSEEINYQGQYYQGLPRMGKYLSNFAAVLASYLAKDPRVFLWVQLGGTLGQVVGQCFAAPADEVAKQKQAFISTLMTHDFLKEGSREKDVEDLEVEDIADAELGKDLRGPLDARLCQIQGIFSHEAVCIEQDIAVLHGMNPADLRHLIKLERQAERTEEEQEKFTELTKSRDDAYGALSVEYKAKVDELKNKLALVRMDLEHLEDGNWSKIQDARKETLYFGMQISKDQTLWDFLSGPVSPESRLAGKSGMVKLSTEYSQQVSQGFASILPLFVSGTAAQLILNAALRIASEYTKQNDPDYRMPATVRYGVTLAHMTPALLYTAWCAYTLQTVTGKPLSPLAKVNIAGGAQGGAVAGVNVNQKIQARKEAGEDFKSGKTPYVGPRAWTPGNGKWIQLAKEIKVAMFVLHTAARAARNVKKLRNTGLELLNRQTSLQQSTDVIVPIRGQGNDGPVTESALSAGRA